jgi:hypothetical protein
MLRAECRVNLRLRRDDGTFDRLLPIHARIFGVLVGVDNSAGGVDDRAGAVGFEGFCDVGGGGALRPISWDEEEGLGEEFAQGGELLGIGGTDDGSDGGVAALADEFRAPLCDELADVLIQRRSILQQHVLDFGCAGVAGADEDEDALVEFFRGVNERADGIVAHVGGDGDGVRSNRVGEGVELGV